MRATFRALGTAAILGALLAGCAGRLPTLPDGVTCTNTDTVPWTAEEHAGATGVFRFRNEVPHQPAHVRVCLFDQDFRERFDSARLLPGNGSVTNVDVAVPPGVYYAMDEEGDWDHHNGYTRGGGPGLDLGDCAARAAEYANEFDITPQAETSRGLRYGCIARPDVQTANLDLNGVVVPKPHGDAMRATLVLVGLGSAALVAAITVRHLPWTFLGFFSRLQRPRLLELESRAKIYDLIEREPGIRPVSIAERLDVSGSQVAYHLRVLLRERLVTRVGSAARWHYFVHGRFGPKEMARRALLGRPGEAKTLRFLEATRGATLRDVATATGCSLGMASRRLRRLVEHGVIVSERRDGFLRFGLVSQGEGSLGPSNGAVE